MSITKTFSRDMGRLAIDPNQAGLVAGYDMVPDGVTLEDKSGNGNHGTISGPAFEFTSIGPSMKFGDDGNDILTTYTDSPVLFSVSGWFNAKTLGGGNFGRLFSKGAQVLDMLINSATNLALSYNNGVGPQSHTFIDVFNLNQTFYLCLVYSTGSIKLYIDSVLVETVLDNIVLNASAFIIGDSPAAERAFDGNISNVKVFNRAITPAEIQAEYQAGARAINWKSDYGVDVSIAAESTPGELSNSVARIESGSHIMTTGTINGGIKKVIECVTDGKIQIPTSYFQGDDTQSAYGIFEYWVHKPDAANLRVHIISSIPTQGQGVAGSYGYEVQYLSSQEVGIARVINGAGAVLNRTVGLNLPPGVWYKFKTTRSSNGEFTLYIDDVLVDMTGGTGTNPITNNTYTVSRHIVFELTVGQRIAWAAPNGEFAITKYQGVV